MHCEKKGGRVLGLFHHVNIKCELNEFKCFIWILKLDIRIYQQVFLLHQLN